ncbi:MAG: hypothetical protein DRI84_01305 [Bacteroidetes bacterium]|nr:MAG: hypothetical protein DRI84_01305 [Bacteroidota bacterium]
MTKYKIGDRVKFMNETGGGIVREIVSPTMVKVETEDGFEVPYMTRDLIIITAETPAEKMFIEDSIKDIPSSTTEEEVLPQVSNDNPNISSLIIYPQDRKEEEFALYLAFAPQHQGMLITGELDIYLVNFSTFNVMFSVSLKGEKAFHHIASGSIPELSRYYLDTIDREQLDSWLNTNVQMIFTKDQTKKLLAPVSTDVRLRGNRFYKESAYQDSLFFTQKAFLYRLVELKNIPLMGELVEVVEKEDQEVTQTQAAEVIPNDEILKHKTKSGEAEVDMHIWELVSDHSSMSNKEMLDIQLSYLERCLESAISHNFHKVIFIHGVGTGKLKQEVQEVLEQYEGIYFRSASMAEYGVGATQVEIPENF